MLCILWYFLFTYEITPQQKHNSYLLVSTTCSTTLSTNYVIKAYIIICGQSCTALAICNCKTENTFFLDSIHSCKCARSGPQPLLQTPVGIFLIAIVINHHLAWDLQNSFLMISQKTFVMENIWTVGQGNSIWLDLDPIWKRKWIDWVNTQTLVFQCPWLNDEISYIS